MLLVTLPPGTFRSLDSWISRQRARGTVRIQEASGRLTFATSRDGGGDRPARDPGQGRYRSWADVTYLSAESEEDQDASRLRRSHVDPLGAGLPAVSSAARLCQRHIQTRMVPLLNAHAGPRDLLFALRTLLH